MDRDPRPGLSGVPPEALAAWFVERGHPAYRAKQVGDGLWRGNLRSAAAIPTLPVGLRDELDASFRFDTIVDTEVVVGDGGLTEKSLHRLSDGATIESVLMHYPV